MTSSHRADAKSIQRDNSADVPFAVATQYLAPMICAQRSSNCWCRCRGSVPAGLAPKNCAQVCSRCCPPRPCRKRRGANFGPPRCKANFSSVAPRAAVAALLLWSR